MNEFLYLIYFVLGSFVTVGTFLLGFKLGRAPMGRNIFGRKKKAPSEAEILGRAQFDRVVNFGKR